MSNIQINRHNFDATLQKIERFSKNIPCNTTFDRVEVNKCWGLIDHKVTGAEMNSFIDKLQDRLISTNHTLKSIISEFKEVYRAFDNLDKEYVAGIIQTIEEIDKTSQIAQKVSDDNAEAIKKLEKTIQVLLNLSQNLEDFKDLCNNKFSEIEQQDERLTSEIRNIQDYQRNFEGKYDEIIKTAKLLEEYKVIENIKSLEYKEDILNDISSIKAETIILKTTAEDLNKKEQALQQKVKSYKKQLNIAYAIGGLSFILSMLGIYLSYVG